MGVGNHKRVTLVMEKSSKLAVPPKGGKCHVMVL